MFGAVTTQMMMLCASVCSTHAETHSVLLAY